MSRLPRGTVTLLFTDIEGSTTLLRRIGRERYVESLEEHRRVIRSVFGRAGGVEVEMQGDSFFFAFPYARDAVTAAAEVQRALAETTQGNVPLKVRIGLHTGEPVVVDNDRYAGLDVHRAARVMSAGAGGQVLVSARTSDLVDGELPDGYALRQLGTFRLKDFERPEPLAQLVGPGLPDEFPPLRAERVAEHGRRRWWLVGAAAAALVAAAVVVVAVLAFGGSAGGPRSNVAASFDYNGKAVKRVEVGTSPTRIAAGDGAVWVVNGADSTLSQVDPTGVLRRTIGAIGNPQDVAVTPGAVWVASRPNVVIRLDPFTGNRTGTIKLRRARTSLPGFQWLATGRGSIWVSAEGRLARIDPHSLRVVTSPLPPPLWGDLAITTDAVWESGDALYHLDTNGRRLVGSVPPLRGPIAAAAGYIWAVNADSNAVAQVDPHTNSIVRTVTVGNDPTGISFGNGLLWVSAADGTVTCIDPASATVARTIQVGGSPQDVVAAYGRVWEAVS